MSHSVHEYNLEKSASKNVFIITSEEKDKAYAIKGIICGKGIGPKYAVSRTATYRLHHKYREQNVFPDKFIHHGHLLSAEPH